MIVNQGRCGLCQAPFTAYGAHGCSVVRIDPIARHLTCRLRSHARAALACPALRQSLGVIPEVAANPTPGHISGQDYRVYDVLTRNFATSTDIAVKAKLPTRARAEHAAVICGKLVRYGLAECAKAGAKTLWRLPASPPRTPVADLAPKRDTNPSDP